MKRLTVLYDGECLFCRSCRDWLRGQRQFVRLEFMPLQAEEVAVRFPGIGRFEPDRQIVAVSDEGAVYRGDSAWIMCLWALREYRSWAFRLARPALRPLARRICELVSENRQRISRSFARLFRVKADDATILRAVGPLRVTCPVPPPLPPAA